MFEGWGSWFNALWNTFCDSLETLGEYLINLLPDSPFTELSNSDVSGYMSWLNWLVPVEQIVGIMEAWVTAILVYYLIVTILRWVKAIQ